ncbi:hypothetical protein [Sphingosinithalassobacter portus]|uniref:hypothetical protein n=1 Tax=Stakelama portus TaxID=2676234 RepID=UPI000D6DE97F|nr:hypothetical protein [Sphingosinithalassobacter portus]
MSTSDDTALERFQNLLRGAINDQQRRSKDDKWRVIQSRARVRVALLKARERMPRHHREDYFAWLEKLANGLGTEFRDSLGLGVTAGSAKTQTLSVESELEWVGYRLRPYVDDIRSFREKVTSLDIAFWEERHEELRTIVAEIRNRWGDSMWLLAAELAIEQDSHGLEAQKKILRRIRAQYPGGLPVFLAFYISRRNEERSTYRSFLDDFTERMASYDRDQALKTYLNYKILGTSSNSDEAISAIVGFEQQNSVFDVYETVIDLLQRSAGQSSLPHWRAAAVSLLESMLPCEDWRVDKLLAVYGNTIPVLRTEEDMPTASFDAVGRAPASAFWRLVDGKITFDEVRAASRSRKETLVTDVFRTVVERSADFEEAWWRLAKFALNFGFLAGVRSLGTITSFITSGVSTSKGSALVASLNDHNISVADIFALRRDASDDQMTYWRNRVGPTELEKWRGDVRPSLVPSLAPLPWLLHILDLRTTNEMASADLIESVPVASLNGPQRTIRANLELELLLQTGEWKGAVRAIAYQVASNSNSIPVLPVRQVFADRSWESLATVDDKLDLALSLYTYWKQTDESIHATYVRFAFEEVLFAQCLSIPSDIIVDDIRADNRVAFFLKFVCVPLLMDTSGFFASTTELLDERVSILEKLKAALPDQVETFQEEIDGIQAAKLIKSGLEFVDSNRVTVDANAIGRWAERKYRGSYARYQALSAAGIGSDAKFEDIVDQLRAATDMSSDLFSVPTNEADTLLLEIILGIKDQFLSDPQYGLEYFLGKRIRHGTIAGHMRGPVEAAHLITERRTLTSPYGENVFWIQRITTADVAQRQRVIDTFSTFSEEYDKLISDVRDKYLHVHSTSHADGLFNVVVTAPQFHIMKAVATPKVDFDHFLSVCLQTFWVLLTPSLANAREFLTSTVREEVVRLFGQLQQKLDEATNNSDQIRLASMAIQQASTEVQRELDTVGSWFERVEGGQSYRFSLRHAIEIAIQSTLKSLTPFRPEIEFEIPEEMDTTQSLLLLLWEFVFVVFDNVHRRARVGLTPRLKLSCHLDPVARRLRIVIKNPVGRDVDAILINAKLASKREQIAAGDIIKGASADRGSGLLKVASLVREIAGTLEFALDESAPCFTTAIEIPVYIVHGAMTLPVNEPAQ